VEATFAVDLFDVTEHVMTVAAFATVTASTADSARAVFDELADPRQPAAFWAGGWGTSRVR
jgi:hypothetical protein